MSSLVSTAFVGDSGYQQTRLGTAAAHQRTPTTFPPHQLPGLAAPWLLRRLPWVQVAEFAPYEHALRVVQTVLQVRTRVADLFNQPMNRTEQQLRLTIEALKERQEYELVNNPQVGLLPNADRAQRIATRGGAPTPDDMDALLAKVPREPGFFLAHPRAIAALRQECSRRDIAQDSVVLDGKTMASWRGIPILPCNKIPITEERTSSILLMRTGKESQGVIGLHHADLQYELEPSLAVRFLSINERAEIFYLVSLYYSVAVLAADALAVLERVELGCPHD